MVETYLTKIIKQHYHTFSDTEKKVADYFLEIGNNAVAKTIANISDDIEVSQATIFKFVKKIGFNGFQDFKISIARNANSSVIDPSIIAYTDIDENDSSYQIASKVINANIASINNFMQSITEEKLDNILSMIYNSETIHFFGIGGSSVIAFDSYQKFLRTKYSCDYIFDYHLQLMYTTKLTDKDLIFLFSHSGQSIETLNLAKEIAKTSAKLVVLTGNSTSELINLADETIIAYSEESKFRTESLSARILYLSLMDIFYVNVMYHDNVDSYKSMDNIRSALSVSKTDNDYIL
ncbi:MurR/RpiR family transcriptional regulator [Tetragenococcus solitarius]|uniref:MurR/RpiR family transcriptional regulator n=1 Tax=Tetragenococcus solitarius TaxID=71453 RepID=A0ABN3Y651_9ENTE|nr:MurR/RpiR family transcriptional regulator [Tetragenococcus solitarius]